MYLGCQPLESLSLSGFIILSLSLPLSPPPLPNLSLSSFFILSLSLPLFLCLSPSVYLSLLPPVPSLSVCVLRLSLCPCPCLSLHLLCALPYPAATLSTLPLGWFSVPHNAKR